MKLFLLYSIVTAFTVSFDTYQSYDAEVRRALDQTKAYPVIIEHRVSCNDVQVCKRMDELGLTTQGLVTAKLTPTTDDIGKPILFFTEKAEPYLLATSDTLKSFYYQKVKVADEVFGEVLRIQYDKVARRAIITYTTVLTNMTPFAPLVRYDLNAMRVRETSFIQTKNGWQWEKKIKKLNPNKFKKK